MLSLSCQPVNRARLHAMEHGRGCESSFMERDWNITIPELRAGGSRAGKAYK
jgi:hypothetical protein